ncbi:MAG: NAD-dependent epimerase/dehydratase family protein [archaeon]
MRVLVTGGAGFIGSHVVDALLARGDEVVVVDDFNTYYSAERKRKNIKEASSQKGFSLFEADIRDISALRRIMKETAPERVIHLAARAGVRPSLVDPELYHAVNVVGTENVLKAAVDSGVRHVVFGSSSSVYGARNDPPFKETDDVSKQVSPYAETKRKGELLCERFCSQDGISVNALRFFTVYGPRGRPDMAPFKFVSRVLADEPIEMYGDGSSKRDYTYVTDIVSGVLSAVDKPMGFEIFNLGNNTMVSLAEFIETVEQVTGKKATINRLPEQKGDVPLTCADISKAESRLDYSPRTSVIDGLSSFYKWYMNPEVELKEV